MYSIGQTHFNDNKMGEAKTVLNDALKASEKFPKQKTESHLWLSWVFQRLDAKDIKEAVRHINEAKKINYQSPELISEIHISLGYCLMETNPEEAKNNFELSLGILKKQEIPKVLANTYLSLAEWHGVSKDIHAAHRYLQQAEEILAKDSMRLFLNRKMERIKKLIESNSTEYFIVAPNDINDWKLMLRKFEKWVIQTTAKTGAKKADIAESLKITEQGLYQMRKRSLKQI